MTIGNGRPNLTYNNSTRVSNRNETGTNCLLATLQSLNKSHLSYLSIFIIFPDGNTASTFFLSTLLR